MDELRCEDVSLWRDGQLHCRTGRIAFHAGVINTIVGNSLAGKTSLLRLIAGLETPDSGLMKLGQKDLTSLSTRQRNVAMVYQQFVNYPNSTVFDNIGTPLRLLRIPSSEIRSRVEHVAQIVRLKEFMERRPHELSGGQQQRVAIARAIVKQPDILLLDEPLANLDYKLREELREELPRFFEGKNTVIIYTTSDPQEALYFGASVTVMHKGEVLQSSAGEDVYRRPLNSEVARLMSDPPRNVTRPDSEATRQLFSLLTESVSRGATSVAFLPSALSIRAKESAVKIRCKLIFEEVLGDRRMIGVNYHDETWFYTTSENPHFKKDREIELWIDTSALTFFDATGHRIARQNEDLF